MCPDVPCARACLTGALERDVEITRSRMGLAVLVDQENCIAFQGLRCEVCYRVCPLIDKAISLQYRPQERTGVHAFFEPVVHSDSCTGCGMCEHACILEEAAIKVFPHALAQGRQGPGYRFGWKENSGVSQDFKSRKTEPKRETEPWNDKALDHTLETLEDVKGLYD
jgi:ferredoxin-type protein NapG